jgi:hypothetical protein
MIFERGTGHVHLIQLMTSRNHSVHPRQDAVSTGVPVGSGEPDVLSNTFQLSGDIKKLSGQSLYRNFAG